jgi:hypothetical protein
MDLQTCFKVTSKIENLYTGGPISLSRNESTLISCCGDQLSVVDLVKNERLRNIKIVSALKDLTFMKIFRRDKRSAQCVLVEQLVLNL